jgi:hypothetical protein
MLLALYLGLSIVLTSLHAYLVNYGEHKALRKERHERLMENDGEAPWAYRILSPAAAQGVSEVIAPFTARKLDAREGGYLFWRWGFTFAFFVAFHRYLERWMEPVWAFAGVLLAAALHGPSFVHYWFQPDSPVDLLVWTLAALLTLQKKDLWLFPLIFIGTLNRETACFVVPIHLALRWGQEPLLKLAIRCAVLSLLWLAPYLALRELIHVKAWAGGKSVLELFLDNVTNGEWILYALSFLGAWFWLPLVRPRVVPLPLWRLMAVMLPYIALLLAFGRIREVRLFLPLLLSFGPAALLVLRDALTENRPTAPPAHT